MFNLVPDKDGLVSFESNLSAYCQLYVVAVDNRSAAQNSIDLSHASGPLSSDLKRDLSLQQPLSECTTKGFTESRSIVQIAASQKHLIADITSTEIQIIDDIKKVRTIMQELQSKNYHESSGVYKELNEIIVVKWPSYKTQDEKLKVYYKYACHEFNYFLYKRDQDFFQNIVKPFLKHKMEKSFVDLYLLGCYEQIIKTYNTFLNFDKLNTFEQCLLIDALVQKGFAKEAQRLAALIFELFGGEKARLFNETSEQYALIFDMIINLNMKKEEEANEKSHIKTISQPSQVKLSIIKESDRTPRVNHSNLQNEDDYEGGAINSSKDSDDDDDCQSVGYQKEEKEQERQIYSKKEKKAVKRDRGLSEYKNAVKKARINFSEI